MDRVHDDLMRLGRFALGVHPQRIIFINRFFWPDHSATAQMLTDLAAHLAAGGWRVDVVTSRQRYDAPKARLPRADQVAGVEVRRILAPRFGRQHGAGRLLDYLGFHLALRRQLARLLAPGDLVVAKTDPPLLSVSVAPIVRRRRAMLVNWVQDLFPEVFDGVGWPTIPGVWYRCLLGLRDASLGDAALNVAIAEGMATRLETLGVAPERIAVIPNWADVEAIRPRPAADSGLRQLCLPQAELVVGYSGNLGPVHDWQTVFDAMLRLRPHPKVRFLFIGGGLGMQALRREVTAAGLDNACFLPYRPRAELGDALAAADLHLVTLKPALEGLLMPSKLYGVLAAGRPVIHVGDPDGESAALVTGAGAGIAVSSGDGAGLGQAILALAADRGRLTAMGGRARRLCEAKFAAANVLDCWEQQLRSIAVRAPAMACSGSRRR